MKKCMFALLVSFSAAVACAKPCVQNGDTLAFLGDSITVNGNSAGGYVNLILEGLAHEGVTNVQKVVSAIAGSRSTWMCKTVEKDILGKRAKFQGKVWMTFSCGVNDVSFDVPLETYRKLVSEIFDKCAASNVNVIVLTPTMIGEDFANDKNRKLDAYVAWLKEEAARRKLPVADLNAAFKRELPKAKAADPTPGNKLTDDGLHVNFKGDSIMAWETLRTMGVPDAKKDETIVRWRKIRGRRSLRIVVSEEEYEELLDRSKAKARIAPGTPEVFISGRISNALNEYGYGIVKEALCK